MKAHRERTSENEYRAAAVRHSQNPAASEPAFGFADRRPGAVAQKRLQEAINKRPSAGRLHNNSKSAQPGQSRLVNPAGSLVQRAPHRPTQGSQIRYQGQVWDVQVSGLNNPNISIHRGNHTVHIPWATSNFTIIRQNTNQDHDLRENDLGAQGGPVDAYAGLSYFDRIAKIKEKFAAGKARALQMIKAFVSPQVNQGSRPSLNQITLEQFVVTQQGLDLVGAGKAQGDAEWQLTWIEGEQDHPRRTWTFVIDADNPLPESSQDPHVGWTVSALAGSQGAVGNTFGHVWLDHVPVMRT